MWKKGGEKLGNEPNDAWVFADKFNLDLSGGPGRLIRERSAVV
jgi:hypothetical protein